MSLLFLLLLLKDKPCSQACQGQGKTKIPCIVSITGLRSSRCSEDCFICQRCRIILDRHHSAASRTKYLRCLGCYRIRRGTGIVRGAGIIRGWRRIRSARSRSRCRVVVRSGRRCCRRCCRRRCRRCCRRRCRRCCRRCCRRRCRWCCSWRCRRCCRRRCSWCCSWRCCRCCSWCCSWRCRWRCRRCCSGCCSWRCCRCCSWRCRRCCSWCCSWRCRWCCSWCCCCSWCRRRRHGRCRCFYRSGLSLQSWIMHFISLHKSLCNHRTNYHSPPIAEVSIRRQNSSKHRLIQNQISATLSQIPNNICCPSLMCITTICSHICAIYIVQLPRQLIITSLPSCASFSTVATSVSVNLPSTLITVTVSEDIIL